MKTTVSVSGRLCRRYRNILNRQLHQSTGDKVYKEFLVRYSRLHSSREIYANNAINRHLTRNILPGIALYEAFLSCGYTQQDALDLFGVFNRHLYAKTAIGYKIMGRLPLFFELLRILSTRSMSVTYPCDGWTTMWIENSPSRIAFDVSRCFYQDALRKYKREELLPCFCQIDDEVYENISGRVKWQRTQTLGRNGKFVTFGSLRRRKNMKSNNVLKIIILYFYMYFIGPLIWGGWMIYRLKIITLQEYLHCLLSIPVMIMLLMYFLVNTVFIIKLMIKAPKNETHQIGEKTAMKINTISVISFGTVATFAFLAMLSNDKLSFYKIATDGWLEKAIIGSLSGAALVFTFYVYFSTTIVTMITDKKNGIYRDAKNETLTGLKQINKWLYIIGLFLFIGTSAASILYNSSLTGEYIVNYKNALFLATLAFPIFMSWLLFKKSGRKITSKMIPTDDTTQRNQRSTFLSLRKIKSIVQGAALLLLIVLLLTQRSRFWLIILITGFVSSLLFGRVYCGWLCPVNALNNLIDSLFKRLRINKSNAPKWLQNRLVGSVIFVLFLCIFILTLILRVRPQLFIIISLLGVLVSAAFSSSAWCNFLCPWGTILKNTSSVSYYRLYIRTEQCVRCGKCGLNCPSKSIKITPDKQTIDFPSCLQCLKCCDICNKDAILIMRNH